MNMDKNKIASWSIIVLTAALISIYVLFALPANAGVSPAVGRNISDSGEAIIGETNLKFLNATGSVIPKGRIINESHGMDIPFQNGFFVLAAQYIRMNC